jgi:hypothetical protein
MQNPAAANRKFPARRPVGEICWNKKSSLKKRNGDLVGLKNNLQFNCGGRGVNTFSVMPSLVLAE